MEINKSLFEVKMPKCQRFRRIFFLVLFLDTGEHQNKAHCKLR